MAALPHRLTLFVLGTRLPMPLTEMSLLVAVMPPLGNPSTRYVLTAAASARVWAEAQFGQGRQAWRILQACNYRRVAMHSGASSKGQQDEAS